MSSCYLGQADGGYRVKLTYGGATAPLGFLVGDSSAEVWAHDALSG